MTTSRAIHFETAELIKSEKEKTIITAGKRFPCAAHSR